MSYDCYFFKQIPGKSVRECYEAICVEEQPRIDLERIPKEQIADELLRLGLGLEKFEIDFEALAKERGCSVEEARRQFPNIELNTDEDSDEVPYQIVLSDFDVFVTFPYGTVGNEQREILLKGLETVYKVLRSNGLVGYDPQLEREALEENFAAMMGIIDKVTQSIYKKLRKPWWKFW